MKLPLLFKDVQFLLTDKIQKKAFSDQDFARLEDGYIGPDLSNKTEYNLATTLEKVQELENDCRNNFYLMAGSSNFHHLEIPKMSKILKKHSRDSLQLILLDGHMDSERYDHHTDLMNCGSWISYGLRAGIISKVLMIGCKDSSKDFYFDTELLKSERMCYFKNPQDAELKNFLSPDQPVYLSIDTDILDVATDWDVGHVSMKQLLESGFWQELKSYNLIGAGIMGHLSDRRGVGDYLYKAFHMTFIEKIQFHDKNLSQLDNIKMFFAVLWEKVESHFGKKLNWKEALQLYHALYIKIESVR